MPSKPPMVVVAFLQCQWARNPDKMRVIYRGASLERRARLNRAFLFYSCITGRRLTTAFGEDLCDEIIWEETTTEIGGESSFKPLPDPAHIRSVLSHFKPDIILTFGRVAFDAVSPLVNMPVIAAPHPAARHASVGSELRAAAERLRHLLKSGLNHREIAESMGSRIVNDPSLLPAYVRPYTRLGNLPKE